MIEDPEFTDVIENITVPAGRSVKLACSVKNLGSYKVSIFKSNFSETIFVRNKATRIHKLYIQYINMPALCSLSK